MAKVNSGYFVEDDRLFEDLSPDERDEWLEGKSESFLKHMITIFADKLREANSRLD